MPTEQNPDKDELVKYVDALAGEGDYWLSITDAARVTRTSEAMARRWVTSGRLPIKRDPAGLNGRTRLVRASDLATIRPIVDVSSAISDDVRKLDLASIPRQQEQVMEDHQLLMALAQHILQNIGEVHQELERLVLTGQEHVDQWDRRLRDQSAEVQHGFDHQLQRHADLVAQVELDNQNREIQQHAVQQRFLALERTLEIAQHEVVQVRQDLADRMAGMQAEHRQQREAADRRHETLGESQRETMRQVNDLRSELEQQAQDLAALTERLDQVSLRAGTVYNRAEAQERVIETLMKRLDEECEARQAVEPRAAEQHDLLQMLQREVTALQEQKRRTTK